MADSGTPEYELERRHWQGPHGTLDSIIKAQRRIKGVIVSVEPGNCRIASEYGEFPFNLTSIKENKKYPDRKPHARDRCEFKVSDANPPKATSIRVAVPKAELTVGGQLPPDGDASLGYSSIASSIGSYEPSSLGGGPASGLEDLVHGFSRFSEGHSPPAATTTTGDSPPTCSKSLPQPIGPPPVSM